MLMTHCCLLQITVDSNIRITSALCHPNYVFIGTYDGQIFEYNLKTSYPPVKYHHHTEPHTKPITCLAYTGNYVFSGTPLVPYINIIAAGDKVIKQWSLGGKIVRSMYACPHCPHYVLAAQNYFFYIQGPDNKAFVMVDAVHGEHLYKMKAADDISAVYIYGNNLYSKRDL